MAQQKVFISVGGTATAQQEDFVKLIEERLRSENFIPSTVGRNNFSADSPLKAVRDLMNDCSGILVIALERTYFEQGKREAAHSKQRLRKLNLQLPGIKLNQQWLMLKGCLSWLSWKMGSAEKGF